MHDDFYKMTGCMHAVSVYFMTRRKDGSPQTSPNRVIQIRAAKLNSIASALLQISFDMEAKENVFQKLWGAEKANVNNAIDGVHTAAGAASHMPPPLDLRRRILSDTFNRAAANPGVDRVHLGHRPARLHRPIEV